MCQLAQENVPMTVTERLIVAVEEWPAGQEVVRYPTKPKKYSRWWRLVDDRVKAVWNELPMEAKLVAALAALKNEMFESLAEDRIF